MTSTLAACRDCGQEVSVNARACPHCGAPKPWDPNWNGSGFEWRTRGEFLGMPWVHLAFGRDKSGRRRVAKGVIAIGQFARGFVAIGQVAAGVVTIAQLGIGVVGAIQLGAAVALICQGGIGYWICGQFVVGAVAMGQIGWSLTKGAFVVHAW